jgi:hypothetical protein
MAHCDGSGGRAVAILSALLLVASALLAALVFLTVNG